MHDLSYMPKTNKTNGNKLRWRCSLSIARMCIKITFVLIAEAETGNANVYWPQSCAHENVSNYIRNNCQRRV